MSKNGTKTRLNKLGSVAKYCMNLNFRNWMEARVQNAVLVATGAYNPIHRGHIKLFYHAKRYLTNQDINVIRGYLIPSNAQYIAKKSAQKGETPLDDRHRMTMLLRAVYGTFIEVLPLESDGVHLNRTQIRNEVQKLHPNTEIIFIAGDDVFAERGKQGCPPGQDMCLVDDPMWGKTILVNRTVGGSASSSEVRKNLMTTGEEPKLLNPRVANYVHKHRLWNAKEIP